MRFSGQRQLTSQLYPSAAPILSIEEPKGLTPNHVHTLNKLINDKAKFFSSRRDPAPYIFDVSSHTVDPVEKLMPDQRLRHRLDLKQSCSATETGRAGAHADGGDGSAGRGPACGERLRNQHSVIILMSRPK